MVALLQRKSSPQGTYLKWCSCYKWQKLMFFDNYWPFVFVALFWVSWVASQNWSWWSESSHCSLETQHQLMRMLGWSVLPRFSARAHWHYPSTEVVYPTSTLLASTQIILFLEMLKFSEINNDWPIRNREHQSDYIYYTLLWKVHWQQVCAFYQPW